MLSKIRRLIKFKSNFAVPCWTRLRRVKNWTLCMRLDAQIYLLKVLFLRVFQVIASLFGWFVVFFQVMADAVRGTLAALTSARLFGTGLE